MEENKAHCWIFCSTALWMLCVIPWFSKVLMKKNKDDLGVPLTFHFLSFTAWTPIKEQASTIFTCDILIGLHGAGMTAALWMYPGSVVIEILDQEHLAAAYYRNVAHLSGHTYFKVAKDTIESDHSKFLPLLISAAEVISNKATFSRFVGVKGGKWCGVLPYQPW